jgi:hypothetical protein
MKRVAGSLALKSNPSLPRIRKKAVSRYPQTFQNVRLQDLSKSIPQKREVIIAITLQTESTLLVTHGKTLLNSIPLHPYFSFLFIKDGGEAKGIEAAAAGEPMRPFPYSLRLCVPFFSFSSPTEEMNRRPHAKTLK